MDMTPIEFDRSSQIGATGHDGNNTCHVQFRTGGLYWYELAAESYPEFRNAEKPGEYFRLHIKGKTKYGKVESPAERKETV